MLHMVYCLNGIKRIYKLQTGCVYRSGKIWPSSNDMVSTSQRAFISKKSSGTKSKYPVSWITVLFTITTGSVAVLTMKHLKKKKEDKIDVDNFRSLGRPALGGDFSLINHNGKPMTNKDLLGRWVLLYFGFTHCPDICPEELEKMGNIVDTVKRTKSVSDLQPIFISIDPERDSPDAVKKYLSDFHPDLVGLTGNREQVEEASRAFRVYYADGPKDGDGDYIVDHTVIMYLLDPKGRFCEYFGQNRSAGEVSSSIISLMVKYREEGD